MKILAGATRETYQPHLASEVRHTWAVYGRMSSARFAFALVVLAACAHGSTTRETTTDDLRAVSPALARYTSDLVRGDLWKRPELSPRDRSLVTVAALIARNDRIELPLYVDRALDDGVKPAEISEVITHLAFYAGWSNAMSAAAIVRPIFERRGIHADQLPPAIEKLLPIDPTAEAQRAERVAQRFGSIAPGVVHYTTDVLFHDLWLRPGLAPRDRSLVTVSALVATGQSAQLGYHLDRAMDNGLTRSQASEVMTQLAFVSGWPSVFSSLTVVKDVLEKRPQ